MLMHGCRRILSSGGVFFLPALAITLSGCAMFGSRAEDTTASGDVTLTEPRNTDKSEKPAPADQTTLAAIEDFLERTRDYQQPVDHRAVSPAPDGREPGQVHATGTRGSSHADQRDAGRAPGHVDTPPEPAIEAPGASANTHMTIAESRPARPPQKLPVIESLSIRAAHSTASPSHPRPTPPGQTTNTPLSAEIAPGAPAFESLLTHLRERANRQPTVETLWPLMLAQLAAGHNPDSSSLLTSLSERERTMLESLSTTATAIRDLLRNPERSGGRALQHVDALRHALAEHADLHVSSVALCRRVVTFGVYDEMTAADFVAGRSNQTILYCELSNFRSRPAGDGHFETRLASRIELLRASDGKSVWKTEEPEIVDRCRQRRTDFFIAQRLNFPPVIPAGDYVLKVQVEDRIGEQVHEASHPMTFLSPSSVARYGS